MIFDLRTYRCRPGTIKDHLKIYEEYGYAPQCRNLGAPLLYAQTEVGDPNSYVHIWVYRDAADRAERRAAMAADPDWQTYLKKSREAGYLVTQENVLLTEAPFFSLPERA